MGTAPHYWLRLIVRIPLLALLVIGAAIAAAAAWMDDQVSA
jgi:hypothetical protein